MPNITMSIDADLLRKARKVALEKNTSVNSMVREYLEKVTVSESAKVEKTIKELRALFQRHRFTHWNKPASREELYER